MPVAQRCRRTGPLNTNDFALEVLNPEKYTDGAFLALSQEEQTAVMADDANWTVLKSYTGNEENVTDDPVESQVAGRIYRLKVTDGDDNTWNGPDTVRIYEIELYGKKDHRNSPGSGGLHHHRSYRDDCEQQPPARRGSSPPPSQAPMTTP